jgi:hypothetical protein
VARRLGFHRNPLRRRSDLISAWLAPAAVAAFLALGPLAAGAASAWVRADNAAVRQAQLGWHRVPAVLLQAVPGPMMTDNGANSWLTWTPARWTTGGRQRLGMIPAAAGARAGSKAAVWLDRAGNPRLRPPTPGRAAGRVADATLVALTGLAVLLAGMALLGRRVLDRRRLAGWEAAWLSVGPHWSRHR